MRWGVLLAAVSLPIAAIAAPGKGGALMGQHETPSERAAAEDWLDKAFPVRGAARMLPFSFRYGDTRPEEFLRRWRRTAREEKRRDALRRTVRYCDPSSGLEVRIEVTRWRNFPAVEWVLYLKNTGGAATPIIADVLPLDACFPLGHEAGCRVHHSLGSECQQNDFQPLVTPLSADAQNPQAPWRGADNPVVIASKGGRSSCGALPFFNIETPGRGIIGAIGWTGDWMARFWRAEDGTVRVQAGMPRTHFVLHPGEQVRTPRVLLLFWHGDRIRGHNLLRRLLISHYRPTRNGKPARAPISFAVWGENRAERQIAKIRWFAENRVPIDNFWIDAGWHGDGTYKDGSNVFNSEWWRHVGNWWPNKTTYPDGLSPIGRAAAEAGFDLTFWFEPERVFRDTYFVREHPEWLLGPIGDNYLFNLGLPEARAGLTDLISNLISEGGITVYRQDFNFDPAPYWQAADAPDRVGISEMKHIEGLYAFWDDLRRRHPGLLIDNCASGGRRIDLETISRSIPLWRSDYQCFPNFDPIGMQGQTHGLGLWVPLSTGACDRPDDYAFRSALGPGIVMCTPPNPTGAPEGFLTPWEAYPLDWLVRALKEEQRVRAYFEGDFYPLLSYSLADDVWAAWQFDRPDLGEGMVVAFRRQNSPLTGMTARLRGLSPRATYEVRDVDGRRGWKATGRELMDKGLSITISHQPGSRMFLYRRPRAVTPWQKAHEHPPQ
ncbi:MAG: alpha-galactosidase [Armatimonadetes bacterium]|nr:alpha-galactosidase [Armatimonadota bacterium]